MMGFEISSGGSTGWLIGLLIFCAAGMAVIVAIFGFGLFREVKNEIDEEEEAAKPDPDHLA